MGKKGLSLALVLVWLRGRRSVLGGSVLALAYGLVRSLPTASPTRLSRPSGACSVASAVSLPQVISMSVIARVRLMRAPALNGTYLPRTTCPRRGRCPRCRRGSTPPVGSGLTQYIHRHTDLTGDRIGQVNSLEVVNRLLFILLPEGLPRLGYLKMFMNIINIL